MSEKKQYLIDEDTLRELLNDSHKLAILERDGVDNWSWYMAGYEEYVAECAAKLPWNEGRSAEDMKEQFEEEDYYIDDLVEDQINAFWEGYCPSGEWIRKEHIINEYSDTESSFTCSCCNKKYKRGEYTPKKFVEEHKFCPNCGAKMDSKAEEVI